MNGVAGGLGPCPHCGEQHPEAVLACPTHKLQLPLAGRLLGGKFRFDRLLGEGGMGWVWAAENIFVKKDVAIKLMRPEFASSPQILGRFRNEATAAGQIGSPHICDILDFGQSELGPYIVMELMRGRPLDDLISASGRVDPGLAVLIMRQTLEGLDAAHRAGIIHRDLKPENIFLSEPTPGRLLVKLVDFGISKFSSGESSGRTGVGVLMGTPEYMSPEQSEGAANVDERTDIWAMGLILFKALTGIDAFGGPTIAATLVAVATREPPSLAELAPHVPAELAAVIGRCIQKDPALRYSSARELSDALAPFENLPPAPPVHTPQTTSHAHPAVGASMAPASGGAPQPMSLHPTHHSASGAGPSETRASPVSQSDAGVGPSLSGAPAPGFTSAPADSPPQRPGSPTWGTENLAAPTTAADSWSMGRAASIEDRRSDGRDDSSSGGKGIYIVVLILILGAVGAGLYFAFGPGASTGDPPPENSAVAAGSTSGASASASATSGASASETVSATTGATGTTGAETESSTESDSGSGSSSSTGDDPDDTGSTATKKKKPNPDRSLVVQSGSYYAPKSESANATLAGAKSHCAKLKKNRFARLTGWKLASSKEVLKFASKSEIAKYLYWTRDKAEADDNGVAVLMVSKKSTERPVEDKRARPFCIATK